jgi:hypothetical protein
MHHAEKILIMQPLKVVVLPIDQIRSVEPPCRRLGRPALGVPELDCQKVVSGEQAESLKMNQFSLAHHVGAFGVCLSWWSSKNSQLWMASSEPAWAVRWE